MAPKRKRHRPTTPDPVNKANNSEATPSTSKPSPSAEDFSITMGDQTMVVLIVGPDQTRFDVDKGLLCRESKYFDVAFNNSFREGVQGSIELGDVELEIVVMFLNWLHTGSLIDEDLPHQDKLRMLARLYIFGDYSDTPKLRHHVLRAFHNTIAKDGFQDCRLPVWSTCREIYEHLPRSDPLRNLMLDIVSFTWNSNHDDKEESKEFERLPEDMTRELLKRTADHLISCRAYGDFDVNDLFPSLKDYDEDDTRDE